MALTDLPGLTQLLQLGHVSNGTSVSNALTATNTKVANIFLPPKTGTITHIIVRTGAVTAGQLVRDSLQTLTSKLPSGSNALSSTPGTHTPTANTTQTIALGAGAVVTDIRTPIAYVREWDAATGTSVAHIYMGITRPAGYPYTVVYASGAWGSPATLSDGFAIRYSDGTEYMIGVVASAVAGVNYSNATGSRIALKYRSPRAHRLWGASLYVSSTLGDFDLRLYDSGGTQLISDAWSGAMAVGNAIQNLPFSTPQSCLANTDYYLAMVPSSATNITPIEITLLDAKHRNYFPLGTNMCKSLYTTATPSWTDTTNTIPFIVPVIDQEDFASGGGIKLNNFGGGF